MQYQALRKTASSKLTLAAAITLSLTLFCAFLTGMSFASESNAAQGSTQIVFYVVLIPFVLPFVAVALLPGVALFLIYKNAASGRPLRRVGFTILRSYMIVNVVVCALAAVIIIVPRVISTRWAFNAVSTVTVIQMLLTLLVSILSVGVLKTAAEVVVYRGTYRKVGYLLPILQIILALLAAADLLFTVLANTVPSLLEPLADYRVSSAQMFYFSVVSSSLGLANSVLFILLSFRGIRALSQPRTPPVEVE